MSNNLTQKQKYQRVRALFDLASQRHIESGKDLHKSTSCNIYLNQEDQRELLSLLNYFTAKFT